MLFFSSSPTGVTCKRSSCSLEGRRGGHLLKLSKRRQTEGVNKGERLLGFWPELVCLVLTREARERRMMSAEEDKKEEKKVK